MVSTIVATIGIGSISAYAESTQTISDGTNNADVTVNGTIGADNTDPNQPIPEGSDKWINVSLDTATIFYNTSSDTSIVSPIYTITNNSGRPVKVKVNKFTKTNTDSIEDIKDLNVNFKRQGTQSKNVKTNLINSGALSSLDNAENLELANTKGKFINSDTEDAGSNIAKFNYSGSVKAKVNKLTQPNFKMNLLFTPTSW